MDHVCRHWHHHNRVLAHGLLRQRPTCGLAACLAAGPAGVVAGLTVGGGFNVNHLDILPTAAGLLLGVVNMFGSVAGALAPYVMARMTEYPNAEGESGAGDGGLSREQWGDGEPSEAWLAEVEVGWSHVFMLAVAVDCAGMLLYGALLSGERQPWAPRSARAQPRGGGDDE